MKKLDKQICNNLDLSNLSVSTGVDNDIIKVMEVL